MYDSKRYGSFTVAAPSMPIASEQFEGLVGV